jgi:exopolysaccharide production protein ExoZ
MMDNTLRVEDGLDKGRRSVVKELIGVQYLRGIAAMLVVLHHSGATQLGPFGVNIFFVISGFVMWATTAAIDVSPLVFWRRRLVRIVPLYWLFLSLLVAVAVSAPQYLNTTEITPENVIKSFLFIPHFHVVQKFIAPILIPGWSLNYEMFFYFIFGIALVIKSETRRAIAIVIFLWSLVLLGLSFHPAGAVAATYTNPGLLLFLDGVILAMIYRARNIGSVTLGAILVGIGVLTRAIGVTDDFGLFAGLSPVLIVAGTLALEPALRRAPSVLLHTAGNASYSIYLSHLFFLRLSELGWRHFVGGGSSRVLDATYVTFSLIFAIGGGIAIHYFIERPMLLLFHQNKIAARSA